MRNYIRMLALWTRAVSPPAAAGPLIAWGGNDDELYSRMQPQIQRVRDSYPNAVFQTSGPFPVYWELNQTNFGSILMGPGFPPPNFLNGTYAVNVWANCRLPDLGISATGNSFYDITTVESPRSTWSHGH